MDRSGADSLDVRVRNALSAWSKLDAVDIRILEGLSLLGPRNLALIAKDLDLPRTSVRYRVKRMLSDSTLFLHLNPYHTNMGLKKAIVFVEATPGYEDELLDCLRVNDFWILLFRFYGPHEGCGGVWTVPVEATEHFKAFLHQLEALGIAKSFEVVWSTCFQGIPVRERWFNVEEGYWAFQWDEWIKEVESIEGPLPYTLLEPMGWPVRVDYEDLLIIKELEINGAASIAEISEKLNMPLSRLKYHYHQHILKNGLVEGFQVEIYRTPFPLSEVLFFKFEFEDYTRMSKFALTLLDKPFAIFLGKVLGENALISQIYLPRWEFRKLVNSLSALIRKGMLKRYHYFIQDMFQTWRQTVPYKYFKDGKWLYDLDAQIGSLKALFQHT